jgi:photosystem II stability/assembly factor-like uncharacterized protein
MKSSMKICLIITLFVLAGCTGTSSGNPIGGVMKSDDSGRTFEPRVFVDEQTSLASSNVLSMAVDPSNNGVIYAGTDRNDLFKSINGAESWQQVVTGLSNIRGVAIDPFSAQTIYVSGLYNGRGSVVKSYDGGQTWERIYPEPSDGTNVTALLVSPRNGDEVYIGTSGGTIARTKNGGQTWENLYMAHNNIDAVVIDSSNAIYVLVGGSSVYVSRDDGATFEDVQKLERESMAEFYSGRLYSLTTSPSQPGVVIVGTDRGVFRSENYGQTWTAVDVIASTIGIPIHAIAVSPHDTNNVVYAAAKAVYTSVPNGWAITDTTSNRSVSVITHDPVDPQTVYIGLRNVR